MFEAPTPRALAALVMGVMGMGQVAVITPAVADASTSRAQLAKDEPVALSEVTARSAGSCTSALSIHRLQAACGNAVGSVPISRWILEEQVDVRDLGDVEMQCVRHGSFIEGVERFANVRFGMSAAEASAIAPEQRLLLELNYSALHSLAKRSTALLGVEVGVFAGMEHSEWSSARPDEAAMSVYAATGDDASVMAGRVSFVLGLQGPCATIDTACASAISALHGGAYAVRDRACSLAVAASIGLKLVPHGTLGAAMAGMLRKAEVS